jgi:hypothetical protein
VGDRGEVTYKANLCLLVHSRPNVSTPPIYNEDSNGIFSNNLEKDRMNHINSLSSVICFQDIRYERRGLNRTQLSVFEYNEMPYNHCQHVHQQCMSAYEKCQSRGTGASYMWMGEDFVGHEAKSQEIMFFTNTVCTKT